MKYDREEAQNAAKSREIMLEGPWTLSFTDPRAKTLRRIPATVPGNVETDLLREGLIEDPFPPDTPCAMRDFERVDDWLYETSFDAPPCKAGEEVRLVFDGIDTIADVSLNGEAILCCENMFIPHSAAVAGKLKAYGNSLSVRIRSPELFARKFSYDAFQVSRDKQAQAYLRKARHAWGWDNAPRLLSAGIWRPVRIEILPPVRFSEVYAYTQAVGKDKVWLGVNWSIETPDADISAYSGLLTLSSDGGIVHEMSFPVEFTAGRAVFSLEAGKVRLWWPKGYGEPYLHNLTLRLFKAGRLEALWSSRFGIREIELLRTDTVNEKDEGEFVFKCNGERIYVRGTNWKPLDALHSKAQAKLLKALSLCSDLNCNMIRIWGGGIYEGRAFFDYCDEQGILVWQDFMFACEFPPRDAFFKRAVAEEASSVIKLLRNHPSLAVWSGDNEVDATFLWGTLIPSTLLPSHNEISREVLKNAVLSHDPYRAYIESSPYVSDKIAAQRRLPAERRAAHKLPEDHLYPADENFREKFRGSKSPFIGETGPFYINAMSESESIVARELPRAKRLWNAAPPSSYTLDRHQTDDYFLTWKDAVQKRLLHFFGREFGLDRVDELSLAVNIVCAEVFKYAIEFSRSRKWKKTGVIWWSLLDMWPQAFNYSVVDYDFKPKLPYWWIRQSQQERCLMAVEPESQGGPELFAANDTLQPWSGRLRLREIDLEGREREILESPFFVPANQSLRLDARPQPAGASLWIMEWEGQGGETKANHYVCGKPPYPFSAYCGWRSLLDKLYRGCPQPFEKVQGDGVSRIAS